MDQLTSGLTVLFNGGLFTVSHLANMPVLFALISGVSLIWLARLEIDDVDRRGSKPQVMRH